MEMALEDEEDKQQQQLKRIKTSHSPETSEDPVVVPTLVLDVVVEILLRLPVESLIRFRSVCKLWRSLISDPHFVKSHLNLLTSYNQFAHHRLIFSPVTKLTLKSCPLHDMLYDKPLNSVELDYPMKNLLTYVRIAGSCNGLLCILFEKRTLFIWNPSTRKSNRLPYFGYSVQSGWYELYRAYGFGYDESTDDYKVVGICPVFKSETRGEKQVKIYSLKTGNRKKIGDFPHGIPLDDYGKFMNGALHWAASRGSGSSSSWTIVSLDLAKETYGEVLQPVYDKGDYHLKLGVLGEWLCVLCYYHGNRADVWVMKVYGVKDSWTKLVSVPYLTGPGRVPFSVPFCISNDGKVLLQCGSKLVLYDAKNGSSSEIQNFDGCLQAYTYVESLVSPDVALGEDNTDGTQEP